MVNKMKDAKAVDNMSIKEENVFTDEEQLKAIKPQIASLAKEKATISNEVKEEVRKILNIYAPKGNPLKIEDIEKAKKCLEEIKNIKVEESN